MLTEWLSATKRIPCSYTKFDVNDIIETNSIDFSLERNPTIDHLGNLLLLAHGNPRKIADECETLLRDADGLGLTRIKNHIATKVLPQRKYVSARVGNFGEILATQFMVETEDYTLPIYKLRFREKRDWAMRLTDLFLVKRNSSGKSVICYGEVKTHSSRKYDRHIGKKAHDSLKKDDALEKPEVLDFVCRMLYELARYEEARFFVDIQMGVLDYEVKHLLFIVHDKDVWKEEILTELQNYDLDAKLKGLTVNVFMVAQLRRVIDLAYDNA